MTNDETKHKPAKEDVESQGGSDWRSAALREDNYRNHSVQSSYFSDETNISGFGSYCNDFDDDDDRDETGRH